MRLSNFDTLYKIFSGEVNISVNKSILRKLVKRTATWLFHLRKQIFQRGRKSHPKIK